MVFCWSLFIIKKRCCERFAGPPRLSSPGFVAYWQNPPRRLGIHKKGVTAMDYHKLGPKPNMLYTFHHLFDHPAASSYTSGAHWTGIVTHASPVLGFVTTGQLYSIVMLYNMFSTTFDLDATSVVTLLSLHVGDLIP